MGVELLVTSSEVRREFVNGADFASDVSDNTPNLTGSVMERVDLRMLIDISWGSEASEGNKFTVYGGTNGSIVERGSGKWSDDGLAIGDKVQILGSYIDDPDAGTGILWADLDINIEFMTETTLYFDDFIDNVVLPGSAFEKAYPSDFQIFGITELTSLRYKPNLIGNDEPANYISKLTGEETGFSAKNIGASWVRMQRVGGYASWDSGECYCQISDNAGTVKSAQIRHIFLINPWYTDGQFDNLINNIVPELFEGSNSIKYCAEFSFNTTITNQTGDKTSQIDYLLGSVGWFGQNLNGLKSDYKVNSITYTDIASGSEIGGVNIASNTRVLIECEKLNGSFDTGNKCGVYTSFLPTAEEYTNTDTDIQDNFIYDRAFSIQGGSITAGDSYITNVSSLVVGGTTLRIQFDIEFPSAIISRLLEADSPRFLIAAQLGDYTLDSVNSDSVMLVAGVGELVNEAIITGLAYSKEFRVLRHNEVYGVDGGRSDAILFNETGTLNSFKFSLDLARDAFIYTISPKIIAYNSLTGDYFELDSVTVPLQNLPIINGVQILDTDIIRGYKLKSGSQFDKLEIVTGGQSGTEQEYTILCGQKMPWQEWQAAIASEGALTSFYDKTKPNNGINKKASNYSDLSGYSLRYAYAMSLYGTDDKGNSGITDYLFVSPGIKVYDYNLPITWAGVIETFSSDTMASTDLQVLSNKLTLFRITWTTGAPVDDIDDFYAIHRIEVAGQQGATIYELSTINEPPANNPLLHETGQLYMYIDSGNVVTECFIDPSKIDVTKGVNISGEINAGSAGLPAGVKLMEDGTPKLTEAGDYKIIE